MTHSAAPSYVRGATDAPLSNLTIAALLAEAVARFPDRLAVAFREQVAELDSVGVTWLSLGVAGRSRPQYLDSIAHFGEDVIRRV